MMLFCKNCFCCIWRKANWFFQLYDEDLYKKSKILKLMACGKCDAPVADKYIECDGTLLLIDLVMGLTLFTNNESLQKQPLNTFLVQF